MKKIGTIAKIAKIAVGCMGGVLLVMAGRKFYKKKRYITPNRSR